MLDVGAYFARLSKREKLLVGSLVGLVIGGVVLVTNLLIGSSVSELETAIDEDRETLGEIYVAAGEYLEATGKTRAMRRMAARNVDLNLKLAVNEIAKRIVFQARNRKGDLEGHKKLADVMQFDQTQETFLTKKKKKRKKKGAKARDDADHGYYRRDQPITVADGVPFQALYDLMEKIEESDQLLYVTDIEMTRDFQDGRNARKNAGLTVSTYYYKGVLDEGPGKSGPAGSKGDEDPEKDG